MKNTFRRKNILLAIVIILLFFIALFTQLVIVNSIGDIAYADDYKLTSAVDDEVNIKYDIVEGHYNVTSNSAISNRSNHYNSNEFGACNQCNSSHGPGKEDGYNANYLNTGCRTI